MRKLWMVIALYMLLITACASDAAPTEEASDGAVQPTSAPTESSPESAPVGAAEEAAIKQLAGNLGLDESQITVVSSEETEFADACLGVAMEDVLCAQVVTPGRTIVLEANGLQYEYHTNEDGSQIQPASQALVWKREGGIAGFCDRLTVFRSGEAYASKCSAQPEAKMGSFANLLTASEIEQFNSWVVEYGHLELDASDPKGVADGMVLTLEFFGTGTAEPTESEEQALFQFAQDLYEELAASQDTK